MEQQIEMIYFLCGLMIGYILRVSPDLMNFLSSILFRASRYEVNDDEIDYNHHETKPRSKRHKRKSGKSKVIHVSRGLLKLLSSIDDNTELSLDREDREDRDKSGSDNTDSEEDSKSSGLKGDNNDHIKAIKAHRNKQGHHSVPDPYHVQPVDNMIDSILSHASNISDIKAKDKVAKHLSKINDKNDDGTYKHQIFDYVNRIIELTDQGKRLISSHYNIIRLALYLVQGPTGSKGPAGPTGSKGPTGPAGPSGSNLSELIEAVNKALTLINIPENNLPEVLTGLFEKLSSLPKSDLDILKSEIDKARSMNKQFKSDQHSEVSSIAIVADQNHDVNDCKSDNHSSVVHNVLDSAITEK